MGQCKFCGIWHSSPSCFHPGNPTGRQDFSPGECSACAKKDKEIERLRQDAFDCSRGDAEQIAGLHEVIGGKEAEIERLRGAIRRGGWDISPCGACGEAVACLPDGLPMCEACAELEASGPGEAEEKPAGDPSP